MRDPRPSLVLTVLLTIGAGSTAHGQPEVHRCIGEPADSGACVIAVTEVDTRVVDLRIDSPAVGEQLVRVLLPAGFDPEAEVAWPTLYLLHGGDQTYTDWTTETDVEGLTGGLGILVVMPEADTGWYSDWWNGGAGGVPMWETFHLTELPRLLERNWQAGESRAVAGFSMGGFGAMSYAARHPGSFRAAASFSGVLNPLHFPDDIVHDIVDTDIWGDRDLQRQNWEAHDPTALAAALGGTSLYVSYGNGERGPLDEVDNELRAWIEANIVLPQSQAFVEELKELGIPATVDAYGPGTHGWRYAERGLHEALPMLVEAMEQ